LRLCCVLACAPPFAISMLLGRLWCVFGFSRISPSQKPPPAECPTTIVLRCSPRMDRQAAPVTAPFCLLNRSTTGLQGGSQGNNASPDGAVRGGAQRRQQQVAKMSETIKNLIEGKRVGLFLRSACLTCCSRRRCGQPDSPAQRDWKDLGEGG
jgi:hypothetical protein